MPKQLKDVRCRAVKSLHTWENGMSKGIRDIITAPTVIRMIRAALIKVWCAHRSCSASWRGTSCVRLWVSSTLPSSRSWITLLTKRWAQDKKSHLSGAYWLEGSAVLIPALQPFSRTDLHPDRTLVPVSVTLGRQTPAEETIHAPHKLKEIILL